MNRNKALLWTFCALGLGLSAESMAGAITVDGTLSDWGLFTETTKSWIPASNGNPASNGYQTIKNGNTYYTASGDYTYGNYKIYYAIEDYTKGNGLVDPGYGGQAYDAEALYVTWDAANLYIALVTGHDPKTANKPSENTYSAGDFALAFWDGGTPTYTYGIETTGNDGLQMGGIYKDVVWQTSKIWHKNPPDITSISSGTLQQDKVTLSINDITTGIGTGGHKKDGNWIPDKHWIYELSAPLSAFGDIAGKNLSVYWTMNCANDIITVEDDIPTIDEPPVWALLGLTLPAVFWRRRRSAKR